MTYEVLVTCPHLQRTLGEYDELFARHDVRVTAPPLEQALSEEHLLRIIDRFDGVVAGDDPFTRAVIEAGRRLKIIAKWGIGLDAIDLDAARERGVAVTNTPDVFADEVADVVAGYLVLLSRQLHLLDRSVREGGWAKIPGTSLRGATLGVVGVGSIGRAVVERGRAFGMRVLGYDVAAGARPDAPPDLFVPLDRLLAESDYVSLNCNLTPHNRHMIGARELQRMKKGARLVNTARGALVDEAALIDALERGHVGGAALDVFEVEPLPADSPLRRFEQCIFGTHNASNTEQAVRRVNERAIQNLLDGLGARERSA